jgi:Na+/H+ antiporter NhaD/arsenite permease-like protein
MAVGMTNTSQQIVMGLSLWAATILFLVVYGLIISEKIHKTIVAIFGAAQMIMLGIVTQTDLS